MLVMTLAAAIGSARADQSVCSIQLDSYAQVSQGAEATITSGQVSVDFLIVWLLHGITATDSDDAKALTAITSDLGPLYEVTLLYAGQVWARLNVDETGAVSWPVQNGELLTELGVHHIGAVAWDIGMAGGPAAIARDALLSWAGGCQ
jgi:hypothetical protein